MQTPARPEVTVQTNTWGPVTFARPRILAAGLIAHRMEEARQAPEPAAAQTMLCAVAGAALAGASVARVPAPSSRVWSTLDTALDYGDAVAAVFMADGVLRTVEGWADVDALASGYLKHLDTVTEAGEAAATPT